MIFLFDTETTALVTNSVLPLQQQPKVIEFYGMLLDEELNKVDELEFLCNPNMAIPEIVTKITSIKNSDVDNLPAFEVHADKVQQFMRYAKEVVAHNLSYDMFVLDCEFARLGRKVNWPAGRVCTVEATEWIKGYRLNLSALYEHLFGEPFSGAHRAKQDVEALASCFKELRLLGDV